MAPFQDLQEKVHALLTMSNRPQKQANQDTQGDKNFIKESTSIIGQVLRTFSSTVGQIFLLDDFPADIDGVYLTERILVIGPVRRKLGEKDRFRNDADSLIEMVKNRHGSFNHALCFDFAPDQSHLDCESLNKTVVQFDMDRPTLQVLREACTAVISWLDLDEKNLAILTCTNGIKSTCLVAACVIAEINKISLQKGLSTFFEERLKLKKTYQELLQKLPPSYDRLLRTYERDQNNKNFDTPVMLYSILLQKVPFHHQQKAEPRLSVRSGPAFRRLECSIIRSSEESVELDESSGLWRIEFKEPLVLTGDATIDVSIGDSASDGILFSLPFPVGFFAPGKLRFGPGSMDESCRHILPADFSLVMVLEEVERLIEDVSFTKPRLCGKELCSLRHIVKPTKRKVQELVSAFGVEESEAVFALQRTNNDLPKAITILTKGRSSPIDTTLAYHSRSSSIDAALTYHNRSKQRLLTTRDENSPAPVKSAKKTQLHGASSFNTPSKRSDCQEEDDPTLSPFLRETIGKGLSSPISPIRQLFPLNDKENQKTAGASRTGTASSEDANEMDSTLLAELTKLLSSDISLTKNVKKVVEGRATIVTSSPASEDNKKNNKIIEALTEQTATSATTAPDVTAQSTTDPKPSSINDACSVSDTKAVCATQPSDEVTLGQHETYGTFFKMLKMGVPRSAVEQRMKRDGFLVQVLDLGPNASVSKLEELENESKKTVGQDGVYSAYFKMLKMGVPHQAVKQKMMRDGVNPEVLDLGESTPVNKIDELMKSKTIKPVMKNRTQRPKTIRWDAIPEERLQKGRTIWHHESMSEDDLQFTNDLENLFVPKPGIESKKTDSMTMNQVKRDKDESSKNKKSLLDGRRAQSICIGIAKIKMNGEDLAKALNDLDESILTLSVLQVIQGCNLTPSPEEAILLLKQPKDQEFAEPDEFLRKLSYLCPDSHGRIEALTFRYLFEEIAEATKKDAIRIVEACGQVRSSNKLKDLLRVVLLIGNQINSRGDKGSDDERIKAFTLASLLKLSQTKSLNKTTTVLEYLVGFLMGKMPEVLNVADELDAVNIAKRIDLNGICKQAKDLKKGLDGVAQSFKGLERFCSEAYIVIESVEECMRNAKNAFTDVLDYFGEDATMTSIDFFTILSSFLSSFEQTKRDLVEKEKRNARKLQQQQQQQTAAKRRVVDVLEEKSANIDQNKEQYQQHHEPIKKASMAVTVTEGSKVPYPHLTSFLQSL